MDSPGLSGCSPRDSGCYESSENLEHGNGHTDNYECAFISKPFGSFMTLFFLSPRNAFGDTGNRENFSRITGA